MEEVARRSQIYKYHGWIYGNSGVCGLCGSSVSEVLRDVGIGKSKESKEGCSVFIFVQTQYCRERDLWGEKHGARDVVYAVCVLYGWDPYG